MAIFRMDAMTKSRAPKATSTKICRSSPRVAEAQREESKKTRDARMAISEKKMVPSTFMRGRWRREGRGAASE